MASTSSLSLTSRQIFWNAWVNFGVYWSDFILPFDPDVLWRYWQLLSVRHGLPYAVYVYTSYVWTDTAICRALMLIMSTAFTTLQYCRAAHALGSFFGTLLTELIVLQQYPLNVFSSLYFGYCFVVSLSAMASMSDNDFSPKMGACSSVAGMFLSLFVGFSIGIVRVLFFFDVTKNHHKHDRRKSLEVDENESQNRLS